MRKTAMAGGVTLMLLATAMLATAYHIPDPDAARNWVNPGTGLVIVQCESTGMNDPINPLPDEQEGVGGLCYASCEHFEDVADKKEKKEELQTTWCVIEPQCDGSLVDGATGEPLNPNACMEGGAGVAAPFLVEEKPSDDPNGIGDWFMRAGSNTRSCSGEWNQATVFKQALLYYGGSGTNKQGVSGHATFFINEHDNFGTYSSNKFTVDPIDDAKTFGDPLNPDDDNCTGNDVGLCDVTAKDDLTNKINACGNASQADKA